MLTRTEIGTFCALTGYYLLFSIYSHWWQFEGNQLTFVEFIGLGEATVGALDWFK